jgi:hypothetical protein
MATKRTPENNWNQTEEQIETLVFHYVERRKTIVQASFHAKMSATLGGTILKHKGLTRSPYDRPRHPWMQQAGAAVAERDAKQS